MSVEILLRQFNFYSNLTWTMATLREDPSTLMIHHWIFLEWGMLQIEVLEKNKTHILHLIIFFRKSCYLWNNVEKYARAGQATEDIYGAEKMKFSCLVTKVRILTLTHNISYLLFFNIKTKEFLARQKFEKNPLVALPWQQFLGNGAAM